MFEEWLDGRFRDGDSRLAMVDDEVSFLPRPDPPHLPPRRTVA